MQNNPVMDTQIAPGDSNKSYFLPKLNGPSNSSNAVQDNSSDVEGKVKTRILSMWNNMKFGKLSMFS